MALTAPLDANPETAELISSLRREIAALAERVAQLEAARGPASASAAPLAGRVAQLEAAHAPASASAAPLPSQARVETPPAPEPAGITQEELIAPLPSQARVETSPAPEPAGVTQEELIAISAALAAYLGVRPHIRQVRLIGSRVWAQEGRVSIQASHRLHS